MVGYLSKKLKLSFADDPGKLYRQMRRATQGPKEDQRQSPPMGEQPQPERKIELCTPYVVDLPIINLQDARRPFKIKVSTIRMTITEALERFNEYMRAEFLECHIGLLMGG
jgi:hypothetical protein